MTPGALSCSNCGDAFDGTERDCPSPSPGRPFVDCGRGGHMFDVHAPPPVRIYVAAGMDRIERARDIAARLTKDGFEIVSRWHSDCQPGDIDPHDPVTRRQIVIDNCADIDSANLLIAYVAGGMPKCTWTEIGFALGRNMPVVMGAEPGLAGKNVIDAHPRVAVYTSDEAMLGTVRAVCDAWRIGKAP